MTEESTGMVELIREKELSDLYVLGAKARNRLHELIDEGKAPMIPTIALMDRAFQQRRLLEGASTQNIGLVSKLILESQETQYSPSPAEDGPDSIESSPEDKVEQL